MAEKLKEVLQGDRWIGHPVHPALVSYPIGMWCFGATMDFASLFAKDKCIQEAADHAVTAGLVGAAVSAAAGLAEFTRVPQNKDAQQIALTHAVVNVSAIGVNSVNAIIRNGRRSAGKPGGAFPKLLTLLGIGLITYSGWLGGKMVYRYGTAVKSEGEEAADEAAMAEEQNAKSVRHHAEHREKTEVGGKI